MQTLSTFVRTLFKSAFSLSYYHDVVEAKFSFSLKYFLFFSFLLGVSATIATSLVTLPHVDTFITRFKDRALSLYPQDLVVTIEKGEITTNAAEPLHIPFPFELFTDVPPAVSDQRQMYLVTIDTQAEPNDILSSQSLILVTKYALVTRDQNSGYRVLPLEEEVTMTINYQLYEKMIQSLTPLIKALPWIIVSLVFIAVGIAFPFFRIITLIVWALLLLIPAKLMGLSLSYKKVFQVGLHAYTLPTLIQIVLFFVNWEPPFSFFYTALFLIYMLLIFAELRRSPIFHK